MAFPIVDESFLENISSTSFIDSNQVLKKKKILKTHQNTNYKGREAKDVTSEDGNALSKLYNVRKHILIAH